jgi:hypothetical protein
LRTLLCAEIERQWLGALARGFTGLRSVARRLVSRPRAKLTNASIPPRFPWHPDALELAKQVKGFTTVIDNTRAAHVSWLLRFVGYVSLSFSAFRKGFAR